MIFNKLPMTKSPRSREELSSLKVTFDFSMFSKSISYLNSEAKNRFAIIAKSYGLSLSTFFMYITYAFNAIFFFVLLATIYYIHKNHFWGTLRLSSQLIDIDFSCLKFRFLEYYNSIRYHLVSQYFWKSLDLNSTRYSDFLGNYLIKSGFSVKTPFPFQDYLRVNTSLYNNFLYQSGLGNSTSNFFSNWSALIIIGSVSIVYYFYEILVSSLHFILRMFRIFAKGFNYIIQKFVEIASQFSQYPIKAKLYLIDVLGYENRHPFHYSYTSDQLKVDEQVFLERNIKYPTDSESFKQKLVLFLEKKWEGYGLTFKEDLGHIYLNFKQVCKNIVEFFSTVMTKLIWKPLYGISKRFYPTSSRVISWLKSMELSKKKVFPHLSIYNAEPMAVSSITFRVSGIILGMIILFVFYIKGSDIRVIEDLVSYTYNTRYTDLNLTGPAFEIKKKFFKQSMARDSWDNYSPKMKYRTHKSPTKFLKYFDVPDGTNQLYDTLVALFYTLPLTVFIYNFNMNYTAPIMFGDSKWVGDFRNIFQFHRYFTESLSKEEAERLWELRIGFPNLHFPDAKSKVMQEDYHMAEVALDMYRMCHRDDKQGLHTLNECDYSQAFRETLNSWEDLPYVPVHWYNIVDFFSLEPHRALELTLGNWRTMLHHFAQQNSILAERHTDGIAMADYYIFKHGQIKPTGTYTYKFNNLPEGVKNSRWVQTYGVRFKHAIDDLPHCIIKNALRQHIENRIKEGADIQELVRTVEGVMTMLSEPAVPRNEYTNKFLGNFDKAIIQTVYKKWYYKVKFLKKHHPELFKVIYDEAHEDPEAPALAPEIVDCIEAEISNEICMFQKRNALFVHHNTTTWNGYAVEKILNHIFNYVPIISRKDLMDYFFDDLEFQEFMDDTEEPSGHRCNIPREKHMDRDNTVYKDFLQVPGLDLYGENALFYIALGLRSWESIMRRLFLYEIVFNFAPFVAGTHLVLSAIEIDMYHWMKDIKEYFYPTKEIPSIYCVPQQILNIRSNQTNAISAHIRSNYQISGLSSVFTYALNTCINSVSCFFDSIITLFTNLNKDLLLFVTDLEIYKNDIDMTKILNVLVSFVGLDAFILHTHIFESIFFNNSIISWHLIATFVVLALCSLLLVHCIHAISHFLLDAGFGMEYIRRTGYLFFLYEFIILVACISPVFIGGLNALDQTFVHDHRSVAKYLYDFVPEIQRYIWYKNTKTDVAKWYSLTTDHPFFADRRHINYINKEFKWEFKRIECPYNRKLFTLMRTRVTTPLYPYSIITDYMRDAHAIAVEGYNPHPRKFSRLVQWAHYHGKLRLILAPYGVNLEPIYIPAKHEGYFDFSQFNLDIYWNVDKNTRIRIASVDFFKVWDNTLKFIGWRKPGVDWSKIKLPQTGCNEKNVFVDYPYAFTDSPKRRARYPYLPFNTWPNPNIDYEKPINYVIDKIEYVEFYAPAVLLTIWLSITFYSQLLFGYLGRGLLFEDPLGDEDSWNEHPHL